MTATPESVRDEHGIIWEFSGDGAPYILASRRQMYDQATCGIKNVLIDTTWEGLADQCAKQADTVAELDERCRRNEENLAALHGAA
ncbi:hypothetical protein [Streptomonospora salina]|uniref:Uncharacterized protein n=1 Tax=Streptomonospora salina TaxID=104205 RepID=A0A841E9V1_9ACTN|nr:hypothetical protein [Streptomonospora salina]MBB5999772.1 hypothetical protein [Streptomonospora salina]